MAHQELQVSIPPFFRCPISLDLMRDPVSVCTGVTYDRASIEEWLDSGNNTCPATMQVLQNRDLIPNHTLRRLMQDWCVANSSLGIERIPTPKAPADPIKVQRLLQDISLGYSRKEALKELRILAKDSIKNCMCIAENGALPVLASVLVSLCSYKSSNEVVISDDCQDALNILALLPLNDQFVQAFANQDNLVPFVFLLKRGNLEFRVNIAIVIERLATNDIMQGRLGAVEGIVQGLVDLSKEKGSLKAIKSSLTALYALNAFKRNRIATVDAGVTPILIELLPEADKKVTELSLALLELLCRCAEGRAAVKDHALAIPVVVKKLLRASDLGTEHAVGILWAVCQYSQDTGERREVALAGACAKLCLLLQVECTPKARTKASKLLRLLHSSCQECPCCQTSKLIVNGDVVDAIQV